jgi:CubicO group peptidase (beta-lactamase class C family)
VIHRWSIVLPLAIAFVMLRAGSPWAQKAPAGLPPDVIDRIEKIITRQMSLGSIPGLSISIVVDLEERWSNGYGLADLENSVPAKATTNYRYASIAKAIIATAIMQLVEAGKLDLDAPIQRYVPAFPKKQWTVTTRHLINNVSGIRAYKGAEFDSTQH